MKTETEPHFDLLTEPWIPVERTDGAPDEVDVLTALGEASKIRTLTEGSPLVVFGIHRLLAAILHTCIPIKDPNEWRRRRRQPDLTAEELKRITAALAGRFDLFHPTHPFYQSGDVPLDLKPGAATKSVGYLAAESSTGTNVTHFGHQGEQQHAFCPPCCARGLVTLPPFAIAGGAGIRPGINGTPPTYVLPSGANLAETLWLNYLSPPFRKGLWVDGAPEPLWDEASGTVDRQECTDVEFVQGLTWPPRRIRLLPGPGGECSRCGRGSPVLVRQMAFSQGRSRISGLTTWIDGWAAYTRPPAKSKITLDLLPVRPREGRDLWRDMAPLFLAVKAEQKQEKVPLVVEQVRQLLKDEIAASFQLFALRTDMKAKVFEWRHDRLTLPVAVMNDEDAAGAIQDALRHADGVAGALRSGLRKLHPALQRGTPDPNAARAALRSLADGAERAYWSALDSPFRRQLLDDGLREPLESDEHRAWRARWRGETRTQAKTVFLAVLQGFDADARSLKHAVEAERVFFGTLKRIEGEYA